MDTGIRIAMTISCGPSQATTSRPISAFTYTPQAELPESMDRSGSPNLQYPAQGQWQGKLSKLSE